MLATAVFRLSSSAVVEDRAADQATRSFGQSTLSAIATSGNATKIGPAAAGT